MREYGDTPVADYGHHWKEKERVEEYIQRTDRQEAERLRLFRLIADLAPFPPDAPVRILDIGSGHGPVAAALLDAFPSGSAVGLDLSDAMMAVGRERMARFGDRFRYQVGDFADGSLPSDIDGSFDIIVSAAAIHHLPPERKRSLYRSIYHHTAPGGCFFNLDSMGPSDEYLRERYRQARERERVRAGEEPATGGHGGGFPHYFEPVEDHLRWLREAGFMPVDCFWKELGRALVGGFRR